MSNPYRLWCFAEGTAAPFRVTVANTVEWSNMIIDDLKGVIKGEMGDKHPSNTFKLWKVCCF